MHLCEKYDIINLVGKKEKNYSPFFLRETMCAFSIKEGIMSTSTFQEIKKAIIANQVGIMAAVQKDVEDITEDGAVIFMRVTKYPNEPGNNDGDVGAHEASCVIGGEIGDDKLEVILGELRSRSKKAFEAFDADRVEDVHAMAIGARGTEDALLIFVAITLGDTKLSDNSNMAKTSEVIKQIVGDIQSPNGDSIEVWHEEGRLFGVA